MTPRPPRDGVVALRTLPRRFRAVFAGLGDDESPEALAARPAPDGSSAIGHVAAAAAAVAQGARGLGALLTAEGPEVDPVSTTAGVPSGSLEEHLTALGTEVDALADRAEGVGLDDWSRRGAVAGGGEVTAADHFWQAVDAAVEHLRGAERTLDAARRAR